MDYEHIIGKAGIVIPGLLIDHHSSGTFIPQLLYVPANLPTSLAMYESRHPQNEDEALLARLSNGFNRELYCKTPYPMPT